MLLRVPQMSLPKWISDLQSSSAWTRAEDEKLLTALSIAWEALEQARHWNNVQGLSAESALAQVEIDLSQAMRRIEEMGK